MAGGGDPATSPLYVFGPFLHFLAVAGVTAVVFGTAIWLAVLTVVAVSIVYRLVMRWIVDGSGGSGLCEEEFGPWAVKINAGITIIEYTLTFLVSMSALVTFVADRFPALNADIVGLSLRSLAAVILSVVICALVNRGPRVAAAAFGPATAAVLALLWLMIGASIYQRGFHLPDFNGQAFDHENLHLTLAGYARILALMTGIEIFANLVSAYEGTPASRSKKAFGSLVIVMVSTCATMLVVGPTIAAVADPENHSVSVFTQTMDVLLPPYLSFAGSLVGIAVLLSACAASAQGVQNLCLGLRYRHYVPAWLGRRNRHGVSAKPVWLVAVITVMCFLLFGTHEDTYLALYAAGVFVLLSLTSWAVVKRLGRNFKNKRSFEGTMIIAMTVVAAILTSIATLIIFTERFTEGAWSYLLLVPALYFVLGNYRKRLGRPPVLDEHLGLILSTSYLPPWQALENENNLIFRRVLLPLDLTPAAEQALPLALKIAQTFSGSLSLLAVTPSNGSLARDAEVYLTRLQEEHKKNDVEISKLVKVGAYHDVIDQVATEISSDIIVAVAKERNLFSRINSSSATKKLIHRTTPPVLILRPTENWKSIRSEFSRLLVALDGSPTAEQVMPFVHSLGTAFKSEVWLLTVPEGGSVGPELRESLRLYLEKVATSLRTAGLSVHTEVAQGEVAPSKAIVEHATVHSCDLIMMVSHGSGGVERQKFVKVGSVAERVYDDAPCPLFLISALPESKDL